MKDWEQISKSEYCLIMNENKGLLTCHAACTDPDYISTVWGYKNCDNPLIQAIDQLRYDESGCDSWDFRYFKYKGGK